MALFGITRQDRDEWLQESYVAPRETRDELRGNIASDRTFYDQNFAQPGMTLRNIALGIGDGNVSTASRDAVAKSDRFGQVNANALARDRQRQGLSASSAKSQSQDRRLSLSRVIANVDAGNRARDAAGERRRMAQEFGTQTYGDNIAGANNILSRLADKEGDRENQIRDYETGHNAAAQQNMGSSLGALFTMI